VDQLEKTRNYRLFHARIRQGLNDDEFGELIENDNRKRNQADTSVRGSKRGFQQFHRQLGADLSGYILKDNAF
jgi:hypothetical protein